MLVAAAAAKFADLREFEAGLRAYGVVPQSFQRVTAISIPAAEVGAAGFLSAGVWLGVVGWCTSAILVLFAGIQAIALLRGDEISCHCFGSGAGETVSAVTLGRALVVAGMAWFATEGASQTVSGLDALALIPIGLAVGGVTQHVTLFPVVVRAFRQPARIAPTPVLSRQVSLRDAAPDFSLRSEFFHRFRSGEI